MANRYYANLVNKLTGIHNDQGHNLVGILGNFPCTIHSCQCYFFGRPQARKLGYVRQMGFLHFWLGLQEHTMHLESILWEGLHLEAVPRC